MDNSRWARARNTQMLNLNDSDFSSSQEVTFVKMEFECRICGKIVPPEQYQNSQFCPKCGTMLRLKPQPKHWLFQFNPSAYRWFDRIKETQEPEQWLVSHLVKLIHKGDLVAIWSAGQKAGVYALGEVITNPTKKPLNPAQEKYFLNKNGLDKFREKDSAYVKYFRILVDKPLLQDECKRDDVLLDMQVLMNQQGTNFRLSNEQWDRIQDLTDKT